MTPRGARLLLILVIVTGVALRLPSLWVGLGMDDFAQRAMIDGSFPVARPWWDLFGFTHGAPDELARLQAAGFMPWWSHASLKIAPFRPLASATIWLDVRALGDDPVLAHVHSLVWLAAMLTAAAWTLRYALPFRVAVIALVLLALDESHAYPTAWLANRNALMAATFAFVAVGAHLRWRRESARGFAWVAPVATAAALLSGEYGLGAVAYIVAYEAYGRRSALPGRAKALAPTAVVLVGWAVLYTAADAGAHGSSIYLDPIREPAAALSAAAQRVPILLASLCWSLPTGTWSLTDAGLERQVWLGVGALVALFGWGRLWEVSSVDRPGWWALGAVGAVLPALGGFPAARLTVLGALGICVVLGYVLDRAYEMVLTGRGASRVAWGVVALAIAFGHGVLAPWRGQDIQSALAVQHHAAHEAVQTLPMAPLEGPGLRMVVLCASDPMTLLYPPLIRHHDGLSAPASWWVLSLTPGRHELRRIDERTLQLRPQARPMLQGVLSQLFRRPPPQLPEGSRIDLPGMQVHVVADEDGYPTVVRYVFDRPLHDPSLRFVLATERGFIAFPIGPVGMQMMVSSTSQVRG